MSDAWMEYHMSGGEGGFGDPIGPPPSEWDTDTFSDGSTELEPFNRPRLSALKAHPEIKTLQSSDLDIRLCVHELAEGIAAASGQDPALDTIPDSIMEFAALTLQWIARFPPCPHKGAR